MWHMYLQCLKLLQPMVKEMRLQENTFFDLDPKVNVAQNVAQCPLHHVTYAVTTSKGLRGDAFTRKYILWPLTLGSRSHKMLPGTIYIIWPIQLQSFGVTTCTSKGLEGDAFTRKYTRCSQFSLNPINVLRMAKLLELLTILGAKGLDEHDTTKTLETTY